MEERTSSPGGASAPFDQSGLFVRRATGLVRELGLRDVFTLNFMVANAGTGFVIFLVALTVFPQAELTGSFLIAAVAMLLLVFVYIQLTATLPRSGGDYVFLSRLVHPAIGAAIGCTLLVLFMYVNGVNAVLWSQIYFPFFFQALAEAFSAPGLETVATKISGETASFLVSAGTFLILAVVAYLGLRWITKFMFWCLVVGTVGLLVVFGQFLAHTGDSFVSIFNANAHVADAYAKVISTAQDQGLAVGVQTGAVFNAVAFTTLLLIGITWSVYPGGEIRRPARTTKYGMLLGLAFAALVYLVAWLTLRGMAGLHFLQAASWLSSNDPDAYAAITEVQPSGSALALLVSGDPVTDVILAITFPAWILAILLAYYLVLPRIIFAQAFDRLLPIRIADVSARTHSPTYAIALATLGFIGFSALAIYTSVLAELFRNTTLLFLAVFIVVSLAATAMPWLRPELYSASPKVFSGSWFGLPPITVIGALSTAANGGILYLVAKNASLSGGYDWKSVVTLVGIFVWGAGVYVAVRAVSRARGVDIALAMRELPPE